MYKTAVIITLVLIAILSLRSLSLIDLGKFEPVVIRTVTAERHKESSNRETFPLNFVLDSKKLFYRFTSDFKQGRVDIALYDDKGKRLQKVGVAGNFTSHFGITGRTFEAGKPYKIEVIEKNVIGSYEFEISQVPPVTSAGWSLHFMLFAAFITSCLALLILGWWMLGQRRKQVNIPGQTLA